MIGCSLFSSPALLSFNCPVHSLGEFGDSFQVILSCHKLHHPSYPTLATPDRCDNEKKCEFVNPCVMITSASFTRPWSVSPIVPLLRVEHIGRRSIKVVVIILQSLD